LSEMFSVATQNETHYVEYVWNDFNVVSEDVRECNSKNTGTTISFIPSREVFGKAKWDLNIIKTYLSFKQMLIKKDPIINNLIVKVTVTKGDSTSEMSLSSDFIPQCVEVETKLGHIMIWKKIENGTSVGFVNGSMCTGPHINIVRDWVNTMLGYNLSHHFYDVMVILNVPSTLMLFTDQNKTKYAIARQEIEPIMDKSFKKKLLSLMLKSPITSEIKEEIEKRLYSDNIKKIRSVQKNNKKKISDKYHAPSKSKINLFLTEGDSAKGGILQARNAQTDGVYALRGKVKNAKHLSDIANNKEYTDIMSIMGIEPNTNKKTQFDYIIIATDPDPDGIGHICPLLINFFFNWFPDVIRDRKLYILSTPLVVCGSFSDRKYFYSLDEFEAYAKTHKTTNVNYLKGLGSLSPDDWEYVMSNKLLLQVVDDRSARKYLDIAFGNSVRKRKMWLSNNS
ncbi:MAG: toprim domain-containing protein, partial [Sarcina sp.]